MDRRLLVLLAETPVHAGGSDSLGAVDLPIQREATTGLPVIWGQSLKGALRQSARDAGMSAEVAVFGAEPPAPDTPGGDLTKGEVAIGDAQLLLFPAPSLRNSFAWVTSPLLLGRLRRRASLLGVTTTTTLAISTGDTAAGTAGWAGQQVLGAFIQNVVEHGGVARLGAALSTLACPDGPEFDFTRGKLGTDVLVLSDDGTMAELTRSGTDVVARVQLDPVAKTVKHGPFYSEHLPAETVLTAVLAGPASQLAGLAELLDGKPLQLGGDETIGKGVLWCRVHTGDSLAAALGGGEHG